MYTRGKSIAFLLMITVLVSCLECLPLSGNEDESPSTVLTTVETPVFNFTSERDSEMRHRSKEKTPLRISPSDSLNGKGNYCKKKAKCERFISSNNTFCLGVKLPYSFTSLDLVEMTQEQIQKKLQFWKALSHVPKCWTAVQPFLCALHMPRCENGMVNLPSQEMCKVALNPCRILQSNASWSSLLRCEDTEKFPPQCMNEVHGLQFNTNSQCLSPLVPTDTSASFYEGVDGCGLQCQNPLFSSEDHELIHKVIAWGGGICLILNLFAVVTFGISWKSSNKYPAVCVFYINCCYVLACVGFLAQFWPGAREAIVCRKDGTLRTSQPSSSGDNMPCLFVFILIYYSLMAACVWFVIFAYAFHYTYNNLTKITEKIDKKNSTFHLAAWALPAVLTVVTFSVNEVDGNSEVGICFVGYMNPVARGGLLIFPVIFSYCSGSYFLIKVLVKLLNMKKSSEEVAKHATSKIREGIIKFIVFTVVTSICVVVTVYFYVDDFINRSLWRESFKTFMTCKIMQSGVGATERRNCEMEFRPDKIGVIGQVIVFFASGVLMSAWTWTHATGHSWIRFINRLRNVEDDNPAEFKKHKVIAKMYAKRQLWGPRERFSFSYHNTHDDPVDLLFELYSAASQMNTSWANNLPNLVTRRGAIAGDPATTSISSQRRSSLDSDTSCGRSRESRRSRKKFFFRSKRRKEEGKCKCPICIKDKRRGSVTSQESQLRAHFLKNLGFGNPNVNSFYPNLERREANAGLEDNELSRISLFRCKVQSDVTDDDEDDDRSRPADPLTAAAAASCLDQNLAEDAKQKTDEFAYIEERLRKNSKPEPDILNESKNAERIVDDIVKHSRESNKVVAPPQNYVKNFNVGDARADNSEISSDESSVSESAPNTVGTQTSFSQGINEIGLNVMEKSNSGTQTDAYFIRRNALLPK